MAAINIQRGRDHGLPAYTQWREPCGLSPITTWNDLERVVGPQSTLRIQSGYESVDDIDLFVGGLAERPVVGGLVGPVFACIIAQQFSNLRKGDRFWYENGAFESSFTPAQLQSIRQVSFAQVVCRTIGGGTLQPHVFLPHTISTNERMPCGVGSLAPIDLMPWLERDPFIKDIKHDTHVKNLTSDNNDNTAPAILKLNKAFVDSKLDLKTPLDTVNDKINTPPRQPNSKRKNNRKTLRRPTITQKRVTTMKPTRRIATKKKHKRDVNQNDNARGAIYIKIDRPTSDEQSTKRTSISNKRHNDKNKSDREYIILTPEHTAYDIEIKIKPSTKRTQSTNVQKIVSAQQASNPYLGTLDKDVTTTKRPQHFYNVPQPALADGGQYFDGTSRPHFHGIITKRTTVSFDDDITLRPYFTTKRPTYIYGTTQEDDESRPFYNYPTVQQTDQSSYYATQSDSTSQQDDFATAIVQNANTMKPYHSVPLYQTDTANRPNNRPNDRPILNDDLPQKPSYSYRPPIQTYGSNPIYLDDFETTQLPIRLTTTYSYANTIKLQNHDSGYGGNQGSTTNRPHDLMTFYSVMTTKQRKRTKPTKPMTYNQPHDDDYNEDDDDDDDSDNDTTWNPTSVISNIVNTFSDYFGSMTTTRKPYIQHDDDDADDFYTYPTFPQQSFLYSRQKDGQNVDTNKPQEGTTTSTVTSMRRRYDTKGTEDINYESMTYRAAHKGQHNPGVTEKNLSIAFYRGGYLRPEYIKYEELKRKDRNYTNGSNNNLTQTKRDGTLRRPKLFTDPSNANQNRKTPIGLVPIKVLTKPER